jgi:hypothetical protein
MPKYRKATLPVGRGAPEIGFAFQEKLLNQGRLQRGQVLPHPVQTILSATRLLARLKESQIKGANIADSLVEEVPFLDWGQSPAVAKRYDFLHPILEFPYKGQMCLIAEQGVHRQLANDFVPP